MPQKERAAKVRSRCLVKPTLVRLCIFFLFLFFKFKNTNLVAFQTLFVCCGNKEYIQHLRRQRPYIYIIRVDLGVGSLNVMMKFFFLLYLEKMKKKKKYPDNFNFLLVGFWASAGKGRMNNHAEPKDKRAFFPLLGSVLAEGEVLFFRLSVSVCVCTLYEEVKRWRWKCWERLERRRREGDVLSYTTAGGKEESCSNSLRTKGGIRKKP